MGVTCDRCLQGSHARCVDRRTCGCTLCAHERPKPPRKRYRPKVRTTHRPARQGPPGKPGGPRVWANDAERKREHMRRKRAEARGGVHVRAVLMSPEFQAEVKRLEQLIHG